MNTTPPYEPGRKRAIATQLAGLNKRIRSLEHELVRRGKLQEALRQRQESKLAEQERAHLAAIVDSSDDAIVSKTLEGIVTTWNQGAERIFGYRAEEMIGRSITTIIPDSHQHEEAKILARIRRGERIAHYQTVRRSKDGRLLDISLTISPIKNAAGRIIGASKIARDITEQKRTERALAEARQQLLQHTEQLETRVKQRTAQLEEMVRSLDGFCYTIAHDLRAPLRAMIGFSVELLEEYAPALDERGREYAQRIREAAGRMDQLILDLLEYGRLNTLDVPASRVELEQLIQEVLSPLQAEIKRAGAQVHVQQPLLAVQGDPRILRQVMANLLGNALKFVPPNLPARVEVWTERRDGKARICIRDNGIGIKAKHQHKLFHPFVRLVRQDEYPGTGIGLAIVQKAVERMGGRVGFESEYGQGSCFWVELKAVQVSESA